MTDSAAAITTAEAALTEARNVYATDLETLNIASGNVVNGVRGDVERGRRKRLAL